MFFPVRRDGHGVDPPRVGAAVEHAAVRTDDAADLMLAAHLAREPAVVEHRAGEIAARDPADVLDTDDRPFKAAALDMAGVLADNAADDALCPAGRDAALELQIGDPGLAAGPAEEALPRTVARDAEAEDRMSAALKAAREVGHGLKVAAGQIDVRRQHEAPAGRIALLSAGPGEADQILRRAQLHTPLLGPGGRGERKEEQQRKQRRKQAFHSASPPESSSRKRVFSTAPSSSTSSCGSTVSTRITEIKAPRPTARPIWLTYTSLTR